MDPTKMKFNVRVVQGSHGQDMFVLQEEGDIHRAPPLRSFNANDFVNIMGVEVQHGDEVEITVQVVSRLVTKRVFL